MWRDTTDNEFGDFFVLDTGLKTKTKQPLRYKFTQSDQQLSVLPPDVSCL